jgi:uncharacterized membrane protein YsdA (DUF1294 family)
MILIIGWLIYGLAAWFAASMKWQLFLIIYHAIVSLVALIMCALDKNRAINKGRRIPEKHLFFIAAIGGAVGMWIGMIWVRHKTKHISFMLGIPLIAAINAVILFH